MKQEISKDIEKILRKLDLFRASVDKDKYETVLGKAAEPAQIAMQKVAPESGYTHTIKDGGGRTKKVRSGNLKRSIQVFRSKGRGTARNVLVGPVVSKRSKIKSVAGVKKVSRAKRAFYWRFVYYGAYNTAPNRFIDRARNSSKSAVLARLKSGVQKYLDKEISKLFK